MRVLAIDFGTSNTVAALAVDNQAPRTITFDASPLLPSAVFVAADGTFTTGREAQRQARLDPGRFEPNPKRRIDDGDVLLGDRVVSVVDVVAAVLRTVAVEVRRQLGGAAADEVRLTHPAQWGAARQNTLVVAARKAGLGNNLILLPEPVAAAAQFTRMPGRALPPGGTVAVYDLGGGTFDIAVVGAATTGEQEAFHVLAEAGLPDLGGLDFDHAVMRHVAISARPLDPARWDLLQRPADASSRRAARALAEDVRAAKETLSRYPQTDVAVPDPFTDVHLTRGEFEALIRSNLTRSVQVLSTTLRAAGIEPRRLNGIFLVGGSSRIPLVAHLIQEQLGVTPVALDQPETAVALGALLVPLRRETARTAASTPPPPSEPGILLTGPQGPRPIPSTTAPAAGPTVAPARRRRRGPILAAAVAVIVVAAAVVLIVVRPFASAGGGGTPTGGSTTSASSAAVSVSSSASASVSVGPNNAFTSAELAFLGSSALSLKDCGDHTSDYNGAVSAEFKVQRAVRCQLPDSMTNNQYESWLLWVFTPVNNNPGPYLDSVVARSTDKSDPDNLNTAPVSSFTAAGGGETGRVVTAVHLPALGTPSGAKDGVSVLAWTTTGQPFVGMLDVQSIEQASDLAQVWSTNFKPR